MLLGLTIFQIIVFTYFIICTELLLKRNPISDNVDQQWGFGQVCITHAAQYFQAADIQLSRSWLLLWSYRQPSL